jgi:predicted RNA-binding Zn-ribbon protein involved in translation (DUF1610 family)
LPFKLTFPSPQILDTTTTTTNTRPSQTSNLLRLPSHVLDIIFDDLDVLDRCSASLTCIHLLHFASKNEHLDYIISRPPSLLRLEQFFTQLNRGWVRRDQHRYCPDCGKFMSIDPHHWRHVSEKYTREHTGRVAGIWRERREDGWLRYWIERWCSNDVGADGTSTAAALRHEDSTALLCPRCAVVSPETNTWRLNRLAARNERHAAGGRATARRIVSPGLSSPYIGLSQQVNGNAYGSSPDLRGRYNASPLLDRRQVSGQRGASQLSSAAAGLGIQTWL